MKNELRECQNCRSQFTVESEDFAFYQHVNVPPPTWCWRCRAMRRMSFRNMDQLYERTCAATGKKIFTLLPPDAPMPPYDYEYWISDAWNPLDYGREYDFSRPFFDQFRELFYAVPWAPIWSYNSVNSGYSVAADSKNCYLCFDTGDDVEDSAYNVTLHNKSKWCFDTVNCESCQFCYFCINTNNSYKTFFSRNCESCVSVWFSQDCVGCTNCFGCSGLRNKSYYFLNRPFSKHEYEKKLAELSLDSYSGILRAKEMAAALWQKHPVKYQHSVQTKDCTGDYIYSSTELRNCFFAGNAQNCAHSQSIIYGPIRDCMDITSSGQNCSLDYEIIDSGKNIERALFSTDLQNVTDSYYSVNCRQSTDLFGCVAVGSKKYCILNRQYSKEEYVALLPKIREHMDRMPYVDKAGRVYKYGEFFPPEMSPWGYNETQAYEYFPLTERDAGKQGFNWRNPEKKKYVFTKAASELPDMIGDVKDDMTSEVIRCLHDENGEHDALCASGCSTAFRIIPHELGFYRQMNLPLPRLCFHCRHFERVAWRNKPELFKRECMCAGEGSSGFKNFTAHFHGTKPCPNKFETSYAPDRPEIVYCEACYQVETA